MNQENLKDKRIAVVGAGGVGGYLGAMLARTYGHVTLVVRGRRMESIRENGLTDLSFAESLGALETIDFSDNYVTDVSPLAGLQNLKQVTGTDNPVSNYEVLGTSVTVVR